MKSEFMIMPTEASEICEALGNIKRVVHLKQSNLKSIQFQLRMTPSFYSMMEIINKLAEECREAETSLDGMETVLTQIVKEYTIAEENIVSLGNMQTNGQNAEEPTDVGDYILKALWQAFAGDFTDESNMLGITLSVLIGFIPYVGQAADIRDLIADIWNLFDDGPTVSEWADLGFTALAIIPGIGDFLKHSDELAPVLKNLDDIADGLGDATKGVVKKADEVSSFIKNSVDEIKDAVNKNVISKITDPIEKAIKNNPLLHKISQYGDEILKTKINKENDTIKDVVDEWLSEITGWNPEDIVTDFLESLEGDETGNQRYNAVNYYSTAGGW